MGLIRALPLVLLVACGNTAPKSPDAFILHDDAPSGIDTPPPPPGCDYGELDDAGNDYSAMPAGLPEQTMLGFTASTVVCGKINTGHFNATSGVVDIDAYIFTVVADSDVMGVLTAPGAEGLGRVLFDVYDPMQQATVASGTFVADHAIAIGHLPAGTYELDVEADNTADAAAPIDYKVKITTDTRGMLCPKITAAASYTEAGDGAANNGNDMIGITYSATPPVTLTTATTDVAEPTNLTIAAATAYRITGTSANVNPPDDYMDRDTFKIKTGPTTNQLSLRLNWPGATSDLDYYLFPENAVGDVASSTKVGNSEDEFAEFAVKPDTSYWLWIGQYDPTGTPAAVTYDASICGEVFTP